MLNTFRDHMKQKQWPKWLLVVTALSMTLYLAYEFGGSAVSDDPAWAARVNGEPIGEREFLQAARRLDEQYRSLLGENYSQFRSQFQIGTQAVRQLIEREVALQDARRLGLTVTKDELIQAIRTMPGFQGPDGKFIGRDRYQEFVSRQFGSAEAFERLLADDLVVEKWTRMVTQPATVRDEELREAQRRRTERTDLRYVVVPSAEQDVRTEIEPEELRRFWEQHPERYQRGAGVRVQWLLVERRGRMDDVQIDDAAVRAYYEANPSEFSHPEQRRARHILWRFSPETDEAERDRLFGLAREVHDRISAGEDFATLAEQLSQDAASAREGGDLGWFGRGMMVAPFEEAVFRTPVGELAPLTETPFGVHVIQVTDVREAGVRPLDEVEAEIRQKLGVARAEEATIAEAQRIRNELGSAADLAAFTPPAGVTTGTGFVSATEGLAEVGVAQEERDALLATAPGGLTQPLRTQRGMLVAAVEEHVPAGVAPLEEVDSRVRTDLLNDRLRAAALEAARRAVERHGNLDAVARALGRDVQTQDGLTPDGTMAATGGMSPELSEALFGAGADTGDRGAAPVPAGAVVYEITARERFDPAAFEAAKPTLRAELLEQRRGALRTSVLDQLGRRGEIEINEALVARHDGG